MATFMSNVDLKVLDKYGVDQIHASILVVICEEHLLLCTLLLSTAMENFRCLLFFSISFVPDCYAIMISVTLILFFGEIVMFILQSICSRYGLVIRATVARFTFLFILLSFGLCISKILYQGHIMEVFSIELS